MAMKKRIALITGATRGIGKEISLALAKEDIHVILLGRTIGALEEISDKIHLNGGNATCVQFDLNDLNKIYDLSQEIKERWGKLDILISNAAYLHNLTPLSHLSDKDWQISININLSANWLLIKYFEKLPSIPLRVMYFWCVAIVDCSNSGGNVIKRSSICPISGVGHSTRPAISPK